MSRHFCRRSENSATCLFGRSKLKPVTRWGTGLDQVTTVIGFCDGGETHRPVNKFYASRTRKRINIAYYTTAVYAFTFFSVRPEISCDSTNTAHTRKSVDPLSSEFPV
jgi:hypothetical protein